MALKKDGDNPKDRYRELVELGRQLFNKIENYQIKIAQYAVEVCDIRHGGRSDKLYTLTDYANDIGIPNKTLQGWVSTYRNVVLKLDSPVTTKQDWNTANKLNNMLKKERTIANKKAGKPRSRHAYKQDVPKGRINSLYNDMKNGVKVVENEIISGIQSVKHICFILDKRDLGEVSDDKLIELMEKLDVASDLINDYLSENKNTVPLKTVEEISKRKFVH